MLIFVTTSAGYYLGSPGPFGVAGLVNTLLGTLLVGSGMATLNQIMEQLGTLSPANAMRGGGSGGAGAHVLHAFAIGTAQPACRARRFHDFRTCDDEFDLVEQLSAAAFPLPKWYVGNVWIKDESRKTTSAGYDRVGGDNPGCSPGHLFPELCALLYPGRIRRGPAHTSAAQRNPGPDDSFHVHGRGHYHPRLPQARSVPQ